MSPKDELKLRREPDSLREEAALNIYYTGMMQKKLQDLILRRIGMTSAQYAVLSLLRYQAPKDEGLTPTEMSEMMMIRPASMTPLINRMARNGLVERVPHPKDGRSHAVRMTDTGRRIFRGTMQECCASIEDSLGILDDNELRSLVSMLERVRSQVRVQTERFESGEDIVERTKTSRHG
jgi:DNA-binding MarR family transcriptional regulator